ncbi:hypothetical protein [Algoriphagus boritolerans]|uniref:hypothetical protein n=1 Tax=Algoriphagus boritolerans TaxID=308111 RepID=UPI000A74BE44
MKKLFSIFAILGLTTFPVWAQTEESNWYTKLQAMDSGQLTLLVILGIVLTVIVLLLILMVYLMSFMSAVLRKESPGIAVDEPSWWDTFKERFVTGKVDEVGGKEEKAKMMSDHSYDGFLSWTILCSLASMGIHRYYCFCSSIFCPLFCVG